MRGFGLIAAEIKGVYFTPCFSNSVQHQPLHIFKQIRFQNLCNASAKTVHKRKKRIFKNVRNLIYLNVELGSFLLKVYSFHFKLRFGQQLWMEDYHISNYLRVYSTNHWEQKVLQTMRTIKGRHKKWGCE